MENRMKVLLYQVGQNLNRAYRTCEAFGIQELLLMDCKDKYLAGNLFAAKGRVEMRTIEEWPTNMLILETWAKRPINSLTAAEWAGVDHIVIGGESRGLPRKLPGMHCTIPMHGMISGLTVEAALAIALYAWRNHHLQ